MDAEQPAGHWPARGKGRLRSSRLAPWPAGPEAGWLQVLVGLAAATNAIAGPASTSHIRLGFVPQTDSRLASLALEGTGLEIRVPKVHADSIFRVEVLPPPEGLEPGYVAVSLVPIPASGYRQLKAIFETHAAVECYEASKQFFSCMMEEGSSVSEHMLAMTGHAKKLSDLGIVIPNRLGINRVLQSLPPSYKNFVINYNMQNMNKELPELFGMLKAAEIEIKKEHQVLMVNKTTSFKKQGKSKGKFKKGGKKAATPPVKPKNGPKPDAECYYCKEKGHWKRNCSKYLADLKSGLVKKKKEGVEVLPPSEGLEPGYVAVSLVPIPASGYRPSSAGVFIRTGLTITTGERVASGLIWRFGSLNCVSDNAGCFADRPFPAGGSVISFGGFDVYVATVAPPRYPRQVLRCASPPPRAGSSAPASPAVVQVMMAGEELPTKNPRMRGPNLERNIDPNASGSGPKAPPPPSRRKLAAAKRQMEITQREYNRAHGLTPGGDEPSRAGHVRRRGRDLGAEIDRDGAPSPALSVELPVYNTPDKNVRAAEAAAEELSRLEGEELRRQTRRVTELLNAANRQIADPRYVNAPRASHARGAAGNDREGARDTAESASPGPSRRHDSRATHSSGRPSHQPSGSSRSRPPPSRNQEQDSGPRRHHRPAPEASGARQPAHSRLGPRIEPADARDRLDRLVESRIAEEEAPAGPKCFGPRIANEPTLEGFTLPRDTPKYDGTAKPEDWLQDYSTAVGIAKGNKRWAVRYSP
ncbi:hypothetical protein QYE76_002270 [Lolium multiflorum]|uniref:CCHC-type domain-containing protein n=1 Tax=Lolium multiflorum TaxID=4521 RepID=A0AAD8RN94_LOLMU|nr:hypothetical protein QYE76_002270 [Lolium multiflorum]